jgi:hypothetical protein
MKLYYHKTSGGAEYYSTNPEGPDFIKGIVLRVDGDEIEVYSSNIIRQGLSLNVRALDNHDGFYTLKSDGGKTIHINPR